MLLGVAKRRVRAASRRSPAPAACRRAPQLSRRRRRPARRSVQACRPCPAARRALRDARRLAGPAAQVVQLRAPHAAAAHHLDLGDLRAVEREDALDALAVADLAYGEGAVDAAVRARDAHALERLDALAGALDHLDADADGVAGRELRDRAAVGELRDLLLLEFLDDIHGNLTCSSAPGRLLCRPGPVIDTDMARPEIGAPRSGGALRLAPAPGTDALVVAGQQHVRHRRPSHSCGRVKCGYSSSWSAKLSSSRRCRRCRSRRAAAARRRRAARSRRARRPTARSRRGRLLRALAPRRRAGRRPRSGRKAARFPGPRRAPGRAPG